MSSSATLPLSAIAKAIARFMLGEAQLPVLLSHFRTFFTGVAVGAVGCPALWAYLTRNKRDRAKVQLAVYHIVRLLEDRPQYKAFLSDPQQLMNLIEPEVMRLVKKHLTLDEVIEAAKDVKREHVPLATDEPVKKRVKKDRASAKPRRRAVVNPAFIPTPRGFLPPSPSDPEWLQFENASVSDESESDESDVDLDMTDEAAAAPVHSAEGLQEVARGEGKQPVQRVTPMHAPEQGSFGLDYNNEDLYASPPGSPSRSSSSSFSSSSSSSSSSEDLELPPSQPAYDNSEPRWLQEMVAASKGGPKKGRSNGVIRSSPAPAVVRMLHGNRCSGTTLSPIQGSPSITEDPRAPTEAEQAVEPAAAKSAHKLPFGHWSTSAPLEYSSSSSSSSQEAALSACSPTPSMPSSSMSVPPVVTSPAPSLPFSSLGSSPTPSKRKSPSASDAPAPKRRSLSPRLQSPASPAQQPAAPALSPAPASSISSPSVSLPPAASTPSPSVSLSPAASVSSSSSGSSLTPQKRKSPSTTDAYALKRRRLSPPTATPARTPRPLLKRGRGRGCTGDREPRELKYVPRKSPRSTAYTGSYPK